MELYIDREELIQGLNHVQGIVERKSTNQILSNVLLAAKENVLTLTATNTEVTYIGELAANVVVPGAISVDGTHLFQISRSCRTTRSTSMVPSGEWKLFGQGLVQGPWSTQRITPSPILMRRAESL